MNKRVKIILLGLMIWLITFIAGFIIFGIFGAEIDSSPVEALWINGISVFFLGIGLALALFLVYRDKGQDYKRTAWEAGIAWYVTILLMNLIVVIGLFGVKLEFWFPLILSDSAVLIIPIVVGYLLAGRKIKGSFDYFKRLHIPVVRHKVLLSSRGIYKEYLLNTPSLLNKYSNGLS